MACAAASSFARTQTRVKTAKTTRTFAFLFIAEPSPRYGDLYDVGVSSGRGPSGGTLNHTGRDPLSWRPCCPCGQIGPGEAQANCHHQADRRQADEYEETKREGVRDDDVRRDVVHSQGESEPGLKRPEVPRGRRNGDTQRGDSPHEQRPRHARGCDVEGEHGGPVCGDDKTPHTHAFRHRREAARRIPQGIEPAEQGARADYNSRGEPSEAESSRQPPYELSDRCGRADRHEQGTAHQDKRPRRDPAEP